MQLAENALKFIKAHRTEMNSVDWRSWRQSFPSVYPTRYDEEEVRNFLVDRNAIRVSSEVYDPCPVILTDGRKALNHPGGPIAFWMQQDEEDRLKFAAMRRSDHKDLGLWDYVERLSRLLPIPASIMSSIALCMLLFPTCTPEHIRQNANSLNGMKHSGDNIVDSMLIDFDTMKYEKVYFPDSPKTVIQIRRK